MYGGWIEYAVLWTNSLGFIWDIKTFLRGIITEFDRKVEFQNHLFGWIRFEKRFFSITTTKNVTKILQ